MKKPTNSVTPKKAIRPQAGPQEQFLASPADIVIYGGAAGGGKSWALLLEPLRHVRSNPEFAAVIFRRNTTQVRNVGGLWDESMKLYPKAGGIPVSQPLIWRWRKGGKVKFAHLEHEDTVLDWQGAQIPLIGFDELTHFTEAMFFYMLSRNRSMCGIKPYIRATCNPDADSWVAGFISWWIDPDGYAIPECSGVIRWFVRLNDTILWASSKEECIAKYGNPELPEDHEDQARPKSVTFIAAKLSDNKELTKADPNYKSNLMALSRVQRERLLGGNWKVRPAAGMYFRRSDVTMLETIPDDVVKWVRRWDLAATEVGEGSPDPDWTSGTLIGKRKNGRFVVANVERCRKRSHEVRELVKRVANNDQVFLSQIHGKPTMVKIGLSQDPGQAGKEQAESYVAHLAGFSTEVFRESGDKIIRADPFAAQWQGGNVDVVKGSWNAEFFDELEAFPTKGVHDDQVDSTSGGFTMLVNNSLSVWAKLGK